MIHKAKFIRGTNYRYIITREGVICSRFKAWHQPHRQWRPLKPGFYQSLTMPSNDVYQLVKRFKVCDLVAQAFNIVSNNIPAARKGADHWNYGRKHTAEAKQRQSSSKTGENNPKFKGYYWHGGNKYTSARAAAKELQCSTSTLIKWAECEKNGVKFERFV